MEAKLFRNLSTNIFVIIVSFILLLISTSLYATESTMIDCYRVDSTNYIYLGNIQIINLEHATPTCNTVYNDCNGECVGCYLNAESFEICIDKDGNQFKKP